MNFRREVARHPGFLWACGAVEFTIVYAMLFLGITTAWVAPAWAALSIPLTDKITINLGELPQWIVALVAAGGFWKAWRAEKVGLTNTVILSAQGAKIDGLLADRDKANVAKGEAKGTAAGEAIAATRAEGVEAGIQQERASVAAKIPIPTPSVAAAATAPVPVSDKRVGDAVDRMANAASDVATAADKFTEAKK